MPPPPGNDVGALLTCSGPSSARQVSEGNCADHYRSFTSYLQERLNTPYLILCKDKEADEDKGHYSGKGCQSQGRVGWERGADGSFQNQAVIMMGHVGASAAVAGGPAGPELVEPPTPPTFLCVVGGAADCGPLSSPCHLFLSAVGPMREHVARLSGAFCFVFTEGGEEE